MDLDDLDEETITKALHDLRRKLNEAFPGKIEKLVLYGSRARGDYEPWSDVDVAIIVKDLERYLKDDIFRLVADIELEHLVPLSTLVLSSEAYANLLTRERRIALDIQKEGIPL